MDVPETFLILGGHICSSSFSESMFVNAGCSRAGVVIMLYRIGVEIIITQIE